MMADPSNVKSLTESFAQPLHFQRLERSLALPRFLSHVESILKRCSSDESDEGGVEEGNALQKEERRSDKSRLFNFDSVGVEREGLRRVLISSSDESLHEEDLTEEKFQKIFRNHVREKKIRQKYYSKPSNAHYQYYGTGLLSNYDKFLEHQENFEGSYKEDDSFMCRKPEVKLEGYRSKRGRKSFKKENSIPDSFNADDLDSDDCTRDEFDDDYDSRFRPHMRGRSKRKSGKTKSPEVMNLRRRKLFAMIAKKELGKCQRARANNHKEVITSLKKMAHMCTKHWKQKALQSQKNMKETVWRNKRLSREMQAYWKRYERVERDTKRRQEKEAEEQRRMDLEFMEAKRQQRKLNFLITQTELYAHFISKKIEGAPVSEKMRILSQLDEKDVNPRVVDGYNSEDMKTQALKTVENAINAEHARSKCFDINRGLSGGGDVGNEAVEHAQPAMFRGTLKHYQLKGMNWLANLYDQGINGILADEMGLGKTVQSMAFLCHIAEKYAVWGPFLIISPASTLHNWQQEMQRFVPDFKVVPYWGNVQERRILRQFWDQKDLHTKDASFHVVITSYQLVITDIKYFNRIKWQYLILDEAQAIKSSNSMRWKLLLGFSCRNRLLLSGTPIQNSMAELWALLHFIMPTFFDNHDEFSEWFSKDIEGQAENKTRIDEKHLSRLHLILKPFMLRRIKKDVENELSDKIEVMVYCPLTTRQKLLYAGLKQKIRVEDLLAGLSGRSGPGDDPSRSLTSNLMNLVMQFRKVCNHPELFERREARSPLCFQSIDFTIPKIMYEDALLWRSIPSHLHITENMLSIFSTENIYRELFHCFSFLRLIGISPSEAHSIWFDGVLGFLLSLEERRRAEEREQHRSIWDGCYLTRTSLLVACKNLLRSPNVVTSPVLRELAFTRTSGSQSTIYTHTRHVHYSMPETLDHRVTRSQKIKVSEQNEETSGFAISPSKPEASPTSDDVRLGRKPNKTLKSPIKDTFNSEDSRQNFIVPEFPFIDRPPKILECEPTKMPQFLYQPLLKVQGTCRSLYASCRNCAWENLRHAWCSSPSGHDTVWYGHPSIANSYRRRHHFFHHTPVGGLLASIPTHGWSNIAIPDKHTLVSDAGKLYVLDGLLKRLKEGGHRVLIYSQMTRMIDLLEEYMWHRKHTYMRLDGSSKISERRDMVADFQSRADIFVFLLSTRAGGLGINLTAADTVIFYDSDWNPTVDQQAMDRAHRLGQTKQVTVYRLICKGTIEERMLQRAREKSEIQRMVISGGNFKPDHLKPKEVVSLLLDDEEMEKKYQQKQAERKILDDRVDGLEKIKMDCSRIKIEPGDDGYSESVLSSTPQSPTERSALQDDGSNDGLVVDVDSPGQFPGSMLNTSSFHPLGIGSVRVRPTVRGSKRGRPRGVRRGACNAVRKRSYDDIKLPGELFITGESPSTSWEASPTKKPNDVAVKRGPGRPRMKPIGAAAQGTRSPAQATRSPVQGTRASRGRGSRGPRTRKAPAPLEVPVGRASESTVPRSFAFYSPPE